MMMPNVCDECPSFQSDFMPITVHDITSASLQV